MATMLAMTNRVLRRLREDQLADFSSLAATDYGVLVSDFLSDVVEEIKETGPGWSIYDHTINVDLIDGTRQYDLSATLTNSGNVINADSVTNGQSVLLHDQEGCPQVWAFDDATDDTGKQLQYLDPATLERVYQYDRDQANTDPTYFTLIPTASGANSTQGWLLNIWPEPDAVRRIRLRFNTPDDRLDYSTDETTELKLSDRAIYLGTLLLSMQERGEELGEPGSILERRYYNAVAAAVEKEIRVRERGGFFDWRRE